MKTCKELIVKRILLAIVAIAISSILLMFSYELGRDTGRNETVEMIDAIASQYDFTVRQDGWILGMGTNGSFYPNSSDSIRVDYNWDDCKIKLSYLNN